MGFRLEVSRADDTAAGRTLKIPEMGLELKVRVDGATTGGVLEMLDTTHAPGFGPPPHRHRQTEIFRIVQGKYRFEVDGKEIIASAGDVVTVPGGAAHTFRNVGPGIARQIVTVLPSLHSRLFFAALATMQRQHNVSRRDLMAFGRAWGVEFLVSTDPAEPLYAGPGDGESANAEASAHAA
ncbi:cupin domain-containing protein [Cupriavidus pampae]|uniref:Cupin type-2 domain-containing protein n=1 Tax=Cupriavidus pampae TaxID=659251 RepID=A0ABN7Z6Q9_9BURK|nr:cupin domain-containing protein [Cupriavidus pampae]CAG9181609.1 hypothetical protein LMG32289_04881 [Cupriavidus pampae]